MIEKHRKQPNAMKASSYSASRKNAEADAIFFSIGEGSIATDEYGNISRVNNVALEILGYQREDIVGKWFPEVIIAENADGSVIPNMERPITEAFLTGKSVFRKIYYRRKDGTRVPVAQTVSPVILGEVPIGAVEVFRDITEEIELENAKDEFISIASHQLRTPATVVKQYLGIILDGYIGKLTHEQKSILRTAYEHNENQLDTINDLLKVAQADSNKTKLVRRKTDIIKLIRSVIDTQQNGYRQKTMSLVFEAPAEKVVASIDPLHIRMVLENLLDNARKYSLENSTVTLTCHADDAWVKISVKDQGFGIGEHDLPKLFQKFSRLDHPGSSTSGTGLGLYWAKRLIDLHDGKLSVSSKLHKGTTFTIKIPRGSKA